MNVVKKIDDLTETDDTADDAQRDAAVVAAAATTGQSSTDVHARQSEAVKRNAANRFFTLNLFVDRTMRELSPGENAVWLILFRDARPPHWLARTGQANLARRAGYKDVRDVERAVAKLKQKGLVQTAQRGTKHGGVSSYRVAPTIGHFTRRQQD